MHHHPVWADPIGDGASFSVSIDIDEDGSVRLRLRGDLDRATRAVLDGVLQNLDEQGLRHVALDTEEVTFTDSTVVDVVESWRVLLSRRGGDIRLVEVPWHVRRVVELLGAVDLIDDTPAVPLLHPRALAWWTPEPSSVRAQQN